MSKMTKESINRGRQLKFVRTYRGITQSDLCKKVNGLSQENLSRFEAGFNTISNEKVEIIMSVLDWPLSFLERKYPNYDFS